jgi:2-aminoethylphosphonate dioxygenase
MTGPPRDLSMAEVEAYRRDGFAIVKGMFDSDDVSAWIRECDRLWASISVDGSDPRVQRRGRDGGGEIADRLDPILDISPLFEALALDPRLVTAIGSLLDGTAILFKAKLIMKKPGTAGYGLHQDYPYWEFLGPGPDEYVNATIAFDLFDGANGSLEFFSGRQHERIPAPPGSPFDADETFLQGSPSAVLELSPGDVLLFHSMLPHRSGPNRGTRSRRGLFLTYFPSRYRGLGERYEQGRVDRPK